MNEDKLEKLSALMDGELIGRDRDSIIEKIEAESETRGNWERYHIIGDTMRSTMPRAVDPDLVTRLNLMLENEPTILAPKPRRKLFKKDYVKPLAGLAIAASVTAVAIFGLQMSNQQTPGLESVDGELPQVAIIDIEQAAVPVLEAATEPALVNATSVRTVKYEPANTLQPQQLNRYIMNHNQHNSRMGVQGVSPHARLVGHDANQ